MIRTIALPQLREDRCTGCAKCLALCPASCLAMFGPLVWLPRPMHCVGCGLCAMICPTEAIKADLIDRIGLGVNEDRRA